MVKWKSWLGNTVGKAFRQAWKNFWCHYEKENDGGLIGEATRKFIKFPFEGMESILIKIYNKFYWISADAIQQMGCNIGDSTMGKIDEGINKAIADAKAKVDEAKRYIEDELLAPVNSKIEDAKAKLTKLGINMDVLETDVGKAMSDVSNMKTSISKFQSDIDAFGSKLGSFDSRLTDLRSRASDVGRRLSNAEGSLSTLNDAIETAKNKVREHTDLIDKLETRVLALEGKEPEEKEKPLFPELPSILKS